MGFMDGDISFLKGQRLQREYNWEVVMPMFLPIPGELVSRLVQSVSYSDYEMTSPAVIKDGAFQRFFAGNLTVKPLKITFIENEMATVKLYMASWKNAMLDINGLYKAKVGGYAKDISLLYLTSEGYPIRQVKFQNAFPINFYEANLDYANNGVLKVTISFVFDRVMEGLAGTAGLISNPKMGMDLGGSIGASIGPTQKGPAVQTGRDSGVSIGAGAQSSVVAMVSRNVRPTFIQTGLGEDWTWSIRGSY
jgi:hypothetical protein